MARRIGFLKSVRAALICFAWTVAIWCVLFAGAVARKSGLSASGASLLSFSLPVLIGVLAYQIVVVPGLAGDDVSPRAQFFWMILVPCALAAVVLFIVH